MRRIPDEGRVSIGMRHTGVHHRRRAVDSHDVVSSAHQIPSDPSLATPDIQGELPGGRDEGEEALPVKVQ